MPPPARPITLTTLARRDLPVETCPYFAVAAIVADDLHLPSSIFVTFRPFLSQSPTGQCRSLPRLLPFIEAEFLRQPLTPTVVAIAVANVAIPTAILALLGHFLAGRRPNIVGHHNHHTPLPPVCRLRLVVALIVPLSAFSNNGLRRPFYAYLPCLCPPSYARVCVHRV